MICFRKQRVQGYQREIIRLLKILEASQNISISSCFCPRNAFFWSEIKEIHSGMVTDIHYCKVRDKLQLLLPDRSPLLVQNQTKLLNSSSDLLETVCSNQTPTKQLEQGCSHSKGVKGRLQHMFWIPKPC